MFVHQSQLAHLLKPSDYFSAETHRTELDRLLRPGWHFLAADGELQRDGDFKSLELLGVPLVVRNFGGEVRAFLNVCPHRHARLTGVGRGHDDRFRCQYHGWEYDKDGRTGKIPDAKCFRPWDRENACLTRFRTARLGGMTYVSLDPNGVPLEEYLGPFRDRAAEWFTDPFRLAWHWTTEYAANWKIVVENSLESYHIPLLHQKSIATMPTEVDCKHDLEPTHTTFDTPEMSGWVSRVQNVMVRTLGSGTTNIYTHHHQHPNMIFIRMDVMRMAQLMVPTSPTTTRHFVWVYTLGNRRRWNPFAWVVRPVLSKLVVKVAKQIVMEDAPVFPQVQRGLENSPHRGVIGTREERLFMFQRFMSEAYGRDGVALGDRAE